MSRVYRVRDRANGTISALKLLAIPNEHVRRRMLKEGRIQSRIRHDNVVPVHEILDIGGFVGLLMDHINGPTLHDVIARQNPTLDEALALFGGVLSGVEAAHARDLVHRDLKPTNVLLRLTDDAIVPLVCDFGIAKELDDPEVSDRRKTGTNATLGTPSYMAPEQIRNARHVDARADVWSLGVLLYELCTNTTAFPGDNVLDVMTAVSKGQLRPPKEVCPELPDAICAIINDSIVVDPAGRIESALAMRGRLQDAGFALADRLPRHGPIDDAVHKALDHRRDVPDKLTPIGGPEVRMVATQFQTTTGGHGATTDDTQTPGATPPRLDAPQHRPAATTNRPPVRVGLRTMEMAAVAGLAALMTALALSVMAAVAQQELNRKQSEVMTLPQAPSQPESAGKD